jgi:hypothetical protein
VTSLGLRFSVNKVGFLSINLYKKNEIKRNNNNDNIVKSNQSLYRAITGPEGFRSLRLPDVETIGTGWSGCQLFARG